MRANRRPTSVPTLTNGMHSLSLFRVNELVGPDEQPGDKRKRDHNEELLQAADKGDMDALKQALDAGAEVNATDNYGRTALVLAAQNVHIECLNALLTHKDIKVNLQNKGGFTALMMATAQGHTKCLDALLTHKDIQVNLQINNNDGWTALMMATAKGHTKCLKALLEHKDIQVNIQNKNGKTALMFAAQNGHTTCLEALLERSDVQVNLQDNYGRTALMLAAVYGHTECLKALLANGADPNIQATKGGTALMFAAEYDNLDCLKELLANGVDPNLQDDKGRTALMLAADEGHTDCLKELLLNDDDPNLEDYYRMTALMLAAQNGRTDCLKALLANGADPHHQDQNGRTALMLAAIYGYLDCLKELLLKGADIETKDTNGKTALEFARQSYIHNKEDCVQILEAAAAKENQTDPSELDDEINQAIVKVQKNYTDRRVRLEQDYALKESEMRDRWKTKPPPNLLRDAHDDRVQHRVGHDPVLQRLLADRDALAKQQLESERTAALNAVRGEYQAKLASLNEAEQTELREIKAKRQELHRKYSEAYVADHRCAVCWEIKESLGVAFACGHRLCKGCVGGVKNTCPQCRKKSRASSQRPIYASVRSRGLNTLE